MISNVVFFLCVVCVCQSAYIDTLNKCSIRDDECCKQTFMQVMKHLCINGLEEYNIPPLDPLRFKELHIPILDVLELHLQDVVVKGFKTCVINKHYTKIEKGTAHLDLTCDISVKGRYKAESSSDVIKSLFGGESIHGEGNGKLKIDKLNIKFDYDFVLEKRNGEIYIIIKKSDKINYKYEVLGKLTFAADNLYLGNVESSKLITDFLNQNWRDLLDSFSGPVMDQAMKITLGFFDNFYDNVSTSYFILDNLENFLSH